jgi:hypothetical protein
MTKEVARRKFALLQGHSPRRITKIPSLPLLPTILGRPSMRFPGRAESIGPMWPNKTKSWGGDRSPPVGRPPGPGKRTRREEHALLIVRDEFRTGYSLIGLLASRARLRFTGTVRINCGRKIQNRLPSNGKCGFPSVSHSRGTPHYLRLSAFICG